MHYYIYALITIMLKPILIIFFGLFVFQTAKAQIKIPADTVVLYLKNSGRIVKSKDSADYFMVILPADSGTDKTLHPINEYYPNGKRRLTESAIIDLSKSGGLIVEGMCMEFYPNGHRKRITNYLYNHQVGSVIEYYLNGKIYSLRNHAENDIMHLIECRDSTGNILAENGKGYWIKFDEGFKEIVSSGPVIDSLESGQWHGKLGDTSKYDCLYVKGIITTGTGYDKAGKAYPFTSFNIDPVYNGGLSEFYKFIGNNLHYPTADKQNNVQGKVLITFVIEKDGTLSNAKVLRAPDESLGTEALRVIKLSPPWKPGAKFGMPASMQFTVPISFSLTSR